MSYMWQSRFYLLAGSNPKRITCLYSFCCLMVRIDGSVVSISYDRLPRSSAYCRPSLEMAFDNMFIFWCNFDSFGHKCCCVSWIGSLQYQLLFVLDNFTIYGHTKIHVCLWSILSVVYRCHGCVAFLVPSLFSVLNVTGKIGVLLIPLFVVLFWGGMREFKRRWKRGSLLAFSFVLSQLLWFIWGNEQVWSVLLERQCSTKW